MISLFTIIHSNAILVPFWLYSSADSSAILVHTVYNQVLILVLILVPILVLILVLILMPF